MTQKSHERIGVFAGTFDPFTVGHADIVARALAIFDRIIICVGINIRKDGSAESAEARAEQIRHIYAHEPRVSVDTNAGLTSEYAISKGACALVRGIRSVKDFEYERDLADANRALSGIETVVLYADPTKSWVSSSLVRELQAYGKDVDPLLP